MEEIWKDIEGYEGRYQVSTLGRVRSLDIVITQPNPHNGTPMERVIRGRIIKPHRSRGYLRVNLSHGKRVISKYSVHRLVATAFLQNPQNLPEVNHKNEIKNDNRVENLEWCSSKYNNNYGTRIEKVSITNGKKVLQIDKNGKTLAVFNSIHEAAKFMGKSFGNIWFCCVGKRNTAYGYRWRYADE